MSATVLLQMDMEDDAAEKRIQITLENVTSYVTSPSDLVAGTSSLQELRSPPLQRDQCLLQFSWSWHSNLEKACGHRVSSWQVNRRHGASSTFSAACQVTRHSKESSFRPFRQSAESVGRRNIWVAFHHVPYQSCLLYDITSDAGMLHDEWPYPEFYQVADKELMGSTLGTSPTAQFKWGMQKPTWMSTTYVT